MLLFAVSYPLIFMIREASLYAEQPSARMNIEAV